MPKSKKRQNWGFSPTEGDRINRSRRIFFARERTPWVCYSAPNLALIGKRGSVQEEYAVCSLLCAKIALIGEGESATGADKFQNFVKIAIFQRFCDPQGQ